MGDLPEFRVAPMLRCCSIVDSTHGIVCGREAVYARPSTGLIVMHYFCPTHAMDFDVPIPPDAIVLRVRVASTIDLAGITLHRVSAQLEAVERLRQAVEAVGGRLDVLDVVSTLGRRAAPASSGAKTGEGGSLGEPPLKP